MGLYQHIRDAWKKPKEAQGEAYKQRMIDLRAEPVSVRVKRPTRLDRARSLGYRAKQGIIVIRQRVERGGHKRPKIRAGRRPRNFHRVLSLRKSYKQIAEERVQRHYPNMVVLNSYHVAEDGKRKWYEVILVDPESSTIKNDKNLKWVTNSTNRSRVYQGKTSTGRKTRGMAAKSKGHEKARPSRRANKRLQ